MGTGLASFVARLSERKEPPARIPAAQVPTKILLRMLFSQDFVVFGRPAARDPVWLGVGRRASGASRKTNNRFDIEHFDEEDGLTEGVGVLLCVLCIHCDGPS